MNKLNENLGEKRAIDRIPVEIWETIFGHLSHGRDVCNVYHSTMDWKIILKQTRNTWMFFQIFPVIAGWISKNDGYKCRLVCKNWCSAVDHFMENNILKRTATGENQYDIEDKLDLYQDTSLEIYRDYMTIEEKKKILKDFPDHKQCQLIGRSLSVIYPKDDNNPNEDEQIDLQILKNFSLRIHYLNIRFYIGPTMCSLCTFVKCFNLFDLKHLRKLKVVQDDDDFSLLRRENCRESSEYNCLQNSVNGLIDEHKNGFPKKLETLNLLHFYSRRYPNLINTIFELLYSANLSSISINMTNFIFPENTYLPNLAHLKITVYSVANMINLQTLTSPIRRLFIEYDSCGDKDTETFFETIQHFGDTLRNLDLQFKGLFRSPLEKVQPFMTSGILRLPVIKTVRIKGFLLPSYNFITGLSSLQYFYIDVFPSLWEKHTDPTLKLYLNEQLDIGKRLEKLVHGSNDKNKRPNLYDSNLWMIFNKLRLISVRESYAKKWECRRDNYENPLKRELPESWIDDYENERICTSEPCFCV